MDILHSSVTDSSVKSFGWFCWWQDEALSKLLNYSYQNMLRSVRLKLSYVVMLKQGSLSAQGAIL